jgi:hypothetical protein
MRSGAAIAAAVFLLALPGAAPAQDAHPAPPPPQQPLKPGHSAGVRTAQRERVGLALIGTGAIIAVVVVAATASSGGSSNSPVNPQSNSTATTS